MRTQAYTTFINCTHTASPSPASASPSSSPSSSRLIFCVHCSLKDSFRYTFVTHSPGRKKRFRAHNLSSVCGGIVFFWGGDLPPPQKNMPGVIVLPILANKRCIYRVAQKVVHLFFDIQYQQLHKSYNLYPLFPGTLGTFW